jgi:hypothetical protein
LGHTRLRSAGVNHRLDYIRPATDITMVGAVVSSESPVHCPERSVDTAIAPDGTTDRTGKRAVWCENTAIGSDEGPEQCENTAE